MAEEQEKNNVNEEATSSELAQFSEEEVNRLYELAVNRLNKAMETTLKKGGDAPVFVTLLQKGSPFANYLSEVDPQIYTLMLNRSKPLEVKSKQMVQMLEAYSEKNRTDIGFRDKPIALRDRLKPSHLLGGLMGVVLGFFASQQIYSNITSGKKKEAPAVDENGNKKFKFPTFGVFVAGSTLLAGVAGFLAMEKIPLLSQKKKEELHKEVSKLNTGQLNDRIHSLNAEIRSEHEHLLDEMKAAAIKADVTRMMKEAVVHRAETQRESVRDHANGAVNEIDTKKNEALKAIHGQGEEGLKRAVEETGLAAESERRGITPDAIRKQQMAERESAMSRA